VQLEIIVIYLHQPSIKVTPTVLALVLIQEAVEGGLFRFEEVT
jgi:hypothetical protein